MQDYTILVVEDEKPLLEAIRLKLENNSLKVVSARTAEQAVGYLKDLEKVDAVWLDHYLLGKETGLDFVAQLKSDGSVWKNIPIFVVSNTATADKIQTYMRLGISKYYTKSNTRLDTVVSDIRAFLEKGE